MRASTAYPKMTNRGNIKYAAIAAIGLLVVVLFLVDTGNTESRATGDMPSTNLRAPEKTAKLSELLAVGMGLTQKAEAVIKEVKKDHGEEMQVKGLTKEGVIEPVTAADNLSNKIFVNGFRNHFGTRMAILSEETEPEKDPVTVESTELPQSLQAALPGKWSQELLDALSKFPTELSTKGQDLELDLSEVLIVVDPLDATKEFGEDLLEYVTTMVCVVYKGKPIAGIINQVFEAERPPVVGVIAGESGEGGGVLYNRKKEPPVSEEAAHTVAISRSHTGEGGNVVEKYLDNHSVLLAGGAGYKALLVLDGKAEAYVHVTNIKSWDVCAADVVTKAAGGEFTDIVGKPLSYSSKKEEAVFTNGLIATGSVEDHKYFVDSLDGRLQ